MNRRGHAELIVELTQLGLTAPDTPHAVTPMLERFVERTAAEGAAYFQLTDGFFVARAAAGVLPEGAAMNEILAHGLPGDTPLMQALERSITPQFFDDTGSSEITAGFEGLGVASLAAAPVRDAEGNLVGAFLMHTFAPHPWTDRDADLFATVASTMASLTARLVAEEATVAAREGALRALGLVLEYHDAETKGHTDRVVRLALMVAGAMGLDPPTTNALRWGAYLHDIGKLTIPERVLRKPGPLTAAEWELMRTHAERGEVFAAQLGFLPPATLELIRSHHERWDGTGYPAGRAGAEIPLCARIFAVCDVYDALTHERPYKTAWSPDQAMSELREQAGRQFDPDVVAAFLRVQHRP